MKSIFCIIALVVFLAACAPAQTATTTLTPSPTSQPTIAPTETATIPTIVVDGVQVPDPKVTNPELFDLKNPDSPIVQFANALESKPEDIAIGLHAEIETPEGMPSIAVIRTSDGVALMMAQQDAEGNWQWSEATVGRYWRAYGRAIGVYVNTEQLNDPVSQSILKRYFTDGMVAWGGDISNISNASKLEQKAHSLNASYLASEVAEPGKFPKDVNTTNVDIWLDQKLDNIAQSIDRNKTTSRPIYINFNEAWGETSGWNPDSNPLRDKYGNDNWVGEYVYRLISRFVDKELEPNKDFVVLFNDARLYNRPNKQDFIFNCLLTARLDAYSKLITNPAMKQKLSEMGINRPEDIQIILGSETHTKLVSNEDNVDFWPAPTDEQLNDLAGKFGPLGGVLVTEVNPFGTREQKSVFLQQLSRAKSPYIRGVVFWNVLKNSDVGNPDYPLIADPLMLFDKDGHPTSLYYDLLIPR